MTRTLEELRDVAEPAWPALAAACSSATNDVHVTEAPMAEREWTLFALQVTARSVLGALALNTGALLVDRGWLRHLGGGSPLNLATVNGLPSGDEVSPAFLVVAVDVLGGIFAVNGGALGVGEPGEVCYFGPDSLQWVELGVGHGAFVDWTLRSDLGDFYGALRWPGWQDEVGRLPVDQGISVFPFPFTKEGRDRPPWRELQRRFSSS